MSGVVADVKYALRLFRKSPGYAAVAIGTLALGISANTVIFSGVEAMLLRPVPAPHPERIIVIRTIERTSGALYGVAYPDLADWRTGAPSFEHMSGLQIDTFNLTGTGNRVAERIRGCRVTAHFFEAFGLPPVSGRTIRPDDDQPGAAPVVVVGHAFAERRFGGAKEALGRTLHIDAVPRTVVGVMTPAMRFPMGFSDFWVPLNASPASHGRGAHFLTVIARLHGSRTIADGRRELDDVSKRIEAEHPVTNRNMGVILTPLVEQQSRGPRNSLLVLWSAVVFVLLICCANLANLSLARAVHRGREFAVRQAIGANRWQLLRQLLAESLLLSLLGGLAGLLLAQWGIEALTASVPAGMMPMGGLSINARVLLFTLFLSVATGMLFGIAPAIRRVLPVMDALRDGERAGAGGPVRSRTSGVLVIAEVALAVTLLGGTALLVAALQRMHSMDLGFDEDNVLTAEVAPKADRSGAIEEILLRLNGAPGVQAAAANWLPMTNNSRRFYAVDGRRHDGVRPPVADYRTASPRYLEAMKIRLISGRFFNDGDQRNGELVAVVNERLARTAWPGQSPVGRRIAIYSSADKLGPWRTVVGVIGNVRHGGPAADPNTEVYFPLSQQPSSQVYLAIRTAGDPSLFASSLERVAKSVDPDLPLGLVRPMSRVVSDAMTPARFTTGLLAIFASLALALATMGLYGVISYVVARRVHEFGVRLAVGATPGCLLRLVMRRAVWLTGTGTLLGLLLAAGVTRILARLLHGVRPEPALFAAIALLLVLVAVLASWMPLRRALAAGPLLALRSE